MRVANRVGIGYNKATKSDGAEELDIDMLKEQGIQLFDTAKKTAQDIADKGKNQLELLNQQARLSKAQRQLGALVYSLHKAGEENQPLVDKYIDAVAEVEKSIEELKANMTPEECAACESEEEEQIIEDEPATGEEAAEEEIEEEPIKLRGETKICPVCKAEVDGDALFCNHCGALVMKSIIVWQVNSAVKFTASAKITE